MENIKFQPKTAQEEYGLISNDDDNFTQTKRYLEPLISQIINRYNLPKETYQKLNRDLIFIDIPIAIKRFLNNENNKKEGVKFSTYFTWYIAQRINPEVVWYLKLWEKIKAIF